MSNKPYKVRAKNYEKPVAVKGSVEAVIKAAETKTGKAPAKPAKEDSKNAD